MLPPVVRGSSKSHSLQDMLVPSIEAASSDAVNGPSRPKVWHEVHNGYEHPLGPYSHHPLDHQREVIVIDDSPPSTRRRMARGDESGRFRPLSSRDQNLYIPAHRSDFHSLPASSLQPSNFLHRSGLSSQPRQCLSRDAHASMTDSAGDRDPIYDPPSSYASAHGGHYVRPLVNEDGTIIEHGHFVPHVQSASGFGTTLSKQLSNAFPVSSRFPRPYEMGHDPVDPGLGLSRDVQRVVNTPLSTSRDGFAVPSEFSHRDHSSQVNVPQRQEVPFNRPFTIIRSAQESSPVRYQERPM
jgi:hypothetical protein